ncbi:SGT1-domain-containing protein [Basidiobolus meristosporus CBS 931.73]|uniref:SGT1-domain-containing protein n=1 Tax=Basidiobolus meristosporus CBS 931.73 TaxID=1314790 RepID=A0A1Y1Y4C3_9FUNG|nr:SGT1-domain-containing protein [Basidiobolus meristosporus CBS 931.73]|eukprot:ORX92838.1 SGT1-domain-containing protein [Basidiobolus meristosporus CBS 931.73]
MDDFMKTPQVEENCVEYEIYFPVDSNTSNELYLDFLEEKRIQLFAHIQPWLNDYIWNKESFNLRIRQGNDSGSTIFTDCIEDEWFIVSLLKEASQIFPEVFDNDGDFLLIEAALQLPEWITPENSQNRVYIYNGALHIIPIPKTPADFGIFPAGQISVQKGIEIIRKNSRSTIQNNGIQNTIQHRLAGYPEKAREQIHRAKVSIPRRIAHILKSNPQLVAPAVEAFYTRDPIAMKACHRMENFPPNTSISTTVRFTRTIYSQLMGQRFHPPKSFHLPPLSSPLYQEAELGMKLACGFEMLCSARGHRRRSDILSPETYTFDSDSKWHKYLEKLKEYNYFQGELEGSLLYRQLEKKAKEQYISILESSSSDIASDSYVQDQIDAIIDTPLPKDSELINNESEDDDSWMDVDAQQLEELLNNRAGMNQGWEAPMEEEDDVNLGNMIDKFKGFVAHESGVDGVEFPSEFLSDEEFDSDDENENQQVQFDPSAFLNILKSTLGIDDADLTPDQPSPPPAQRPSTSTKQVRFSHEESSGIPEPEEPRIEEIMDIMDEELSTTKLGKSFVSADASKQEDDFKPVDVDFNLVQNLLESFKSQQGLPGPVGNILNSMGLNLPRDDAEE